MRVQKMWMLVSIVGLVFISGVARSDRHIVSNMSVTGAQGKPIVVNQPLKSQKLRFTDTDGLEFERTVVRGLPFSAILVTEVTQTNSNSVAVSQRSVCVIYRDRQGRTRRDRMSSDAAETEDLAKQLPLVTTINDPVSSYSYVLENRANIAHRSAFNGESEGNSNSPRSETQLSTSSHKATEMLAMPANSDIAQKLSAETKGVSSEAIREPLGQREIEGFIAEGTRISMTISASAKGNDDPLVSTIERWYSPDLRAVLLVERSDPRFGKIVSRLSRIQRNEPASSLFIVPSGFKVTSY
jgi:hypothetical protein